MTAPTAPTAPTVPTVPAAENATVVQDEPATEILEQDLLVEDVSIDGMCGVY